MQHVVTERPGDGIPEAPKALCDVRRNSWVKVDRPRIRNDTLRSYSDGSKKGVGIRIAVEKYIIRKCVGDFSDVVSDLEQKFPDIVRRLPVRKRERGFSIVRWRKVIVGNIEGIVSGAYDPTSQDHELWRLNLKLRFTIY
ncbi:hypothetical protein A4U53_005340 (plasmid) [Rhizobium ruizarguesonis]|uniref:Uncharacterized protein n=1 Tax=Rhizobium ruizarguesonis TaxID=2081791 RepID=A0ACD5EIK4_9HYPH